MTRLSGRNVKPFIGTHDFDKSRDFYVALGWQLNWQDDDLAELELGDNRFYLQRYYQKDWCDNTMLHVTVDDAQAWFEHVRALIDANEFGSLPGAPRVAPPKEESYGAKVTYVWDPAGNLLHFAESTS
jgi:catechol 2,3-dioxygenase-like lactoylglutathione lyase family enzyme